MGKIFISQNEEGVQMPGDKNKHNVNKVKKKGPPRQR